MVIVKLMGGLGNQMFQYAIGRSVAYRNNADLGLDISWFKDIILNTPRSYNLGGFRIIEKFSSIKFRRTREKLSFLEKYLLCHKRKYFKEKSIFSFDKDSLCLSGDVYLDGYWQCPKYFEDINDILKQEFRFKEGLDKDNEIIRMIKEKNSISIHIRRGDYVDDDITRRFHGICSLDYYKKAIEIISAKIKNPYFFIFSDDIVWAKQNLKIDSPSFFITKDYKFKDYEELIIMSWSKNHIIANSSFSWWAAWLCDNKNKIIIAPFKWLNDTSINTAGLIPNSWIKI